MISNKKSMSIFILIGFIFSITILSDYFLPNSFLTLPLIISSVISFLIVKIGIPKIKNLSINQIIREEGPKNHFKKSNTPTMGGFLVVPIGVIIGILVCTRETSDNQLICISLLTILFMLIGSIDDWLSILNKRSKGLSVKAKLLLQTSTSIIFLYWSANQNWINSSIDLPFGKSVDIGILIWPLALFVILAESNATNLTDGLDGLASGCSTFVFTGLGLQLMLRGNNGDPAMASYSLAMGGAWLGFLIHNQHPAKIFMGDTGSLAIGASISGIALLSNSLFPLLIMGGVFFAESLSVIIQVLFYKITKKFEGKGKRIFLMAPLHHHYELKGINEEKIVLSFWSISSILVLTSLIIFPTK